MLFPLVISFVVFCMVFFYPVLSLLEFPVSLLIPPRLVKTANAAIIEHNLDERFYITGMNNLYEYIDPIASPYEAFLFDSTRDLLPIPAHWHYYVELLYVRKGEIEVSLDNVVSTCTKGAVILFRPNASTPSLLREVLLRFSTM